MLREVHVDTVISLAHITTEDGLYSAVSSALKPKNSSPSSDSLKSCILADHFDREHKKIEKKSVNKLHLIMLPSSKRQMKVT